MKGRERGKRGMRWQTERERRRRDGLVAVSVDPVHHVAAVGSAEGRHSVLVQPLVVLQRVLQAFVDVLEGLVPVARDRVGEGLTEGRRAVEVDDQHSKTLLHKQREGRRKKGGTRKNESNERKQQEKEKSGANLGSENLRVPAVVPVVCDRALRTAVNHTRYWVGLVLNK
jgi:hypothetical protein